MKAILVIYQENPDDLFCFELIVPDHQLELFADVNNKFINGDADDADIEELFLHKNGEYKYEKARLPLRNKHYDLIISTGIFL